MLKMFPSFRSGTGWYSTHNRHSRLTLIPRIICPIKVVSPLSPPPSSRPAYTATHTNAFHLLPPHCITAAAAAAAALDRGAQHAVLANPTRTDRYPSAPTGSASVTNFAHADADRTAAESGAARQRVLGLRPSGLLMPSKATSFGADVARRSRSLHTWNRGKIGLRCSAIRNCRYKLSATELSLLGDAAPPPIPLPHSSSLAKQRRTELGRDGMPLCSGISRAFRLHKFWWITNSCAFLYIFKHVYTTVAVRRFPSFRLWSCSAADFAEFYDAMMLSNLIYIHRPTIVYYILQTLKFMGFLPLTIIFQQTVSM